MDRRRYSIKFSGSITGKNDIYHDGKMNVDYCYMFSVANADDLVVDENQNYPLKNGKVDYNVIFPDYTEIEGMENSNPFLINYSEYTPLDITPYQGLSALDGGQGNQYSIYRREYEIYERPGPKIKGYFNNYNSQFYESYNENTGVYSNPVIGNVSYLYIDHRTNLMYCFISDSGQAHFELVDEATKTYKGEWEPVALETNTNYLRDYNISNDRTYQYIMYPKDTTDEAISTGRINKQIFANARDKVWVPYDEYPTQGHFVIGDYSTSAKYGAPISTHWEEWSVIELEPLETNPDIPVAKQAYKANIDQLWLFKYGLETGAQNQNISRSDFQTLGQFPKIGFGQSDFASGEVTALLGSEIIPYSGQGYVERLRKSINTPLSTNEKTKMLEQWRKLVASKNPKLLRDIKGQNWIVQIISSSNTPKNFYKNQPDTISFSWKQVGDTKNVIIYTDADKTEEITKTGSIEWSPLFKNKKF